MAFKLNPFKWLRLLIIDPILKLNQIMVLKLRLLLLLLLTYFFE